MTFQRTISELGFPPPVNVAGRQSIAIDFAGGTRRTGVYLLTLEGGQFYIGLAKDVVRRFGQHRRTFGARIIGFSFRPAPFRGLAELERDLIKNAERSGLPLEQTEWKSVTYGESDLDSLLDEAEYEAWRADPKSFFAADNRPTPSADAGRISRDQHKFADLSYRTDKAELFALLRAYAQLCVPGARRTEHDFWSVACLPSTNASHWPRLFCVSAHLMEAFVVGHRKNSPLRTWGFMVCAKSPLLARYGSEKRMLRGIPADDIEPSTYRSAGHDQVRLYFSTLQQAQQLLAAPGVAEATGLLMFRVMRKGVSRYASFHSFSLADAMLGDDILT